MEAIKKVYALLILPFLFCVTCCSNFLNGSDLKDQIDAEIQKANARNCLVIVSAEDGTGSFLASGQRTEKIGYEFDLQFNLNQENYIFSNDWLAEDANTHEDMSSYAEFTLCSTENEQKQGTYRISVKIVKNCSSIHIQPKCLLIPDVVSSYPNYDNAGFPQDTDIQLAFNKAVNISDFFNDGQFTSITIKSKEEDFTSYFGTPYLINDDKILVIPTDKKKSMLSEEGTLDLTVSVNFEGLSDSENLSFKNDSYSFTYRINHLKDSESPEIVTDLRLAKFEEEVLSGENSLLMNTAYETYVSDEQSVEQNHIGKKFWFYVQAKDEGSGIKGIKIKECLLKTVEQNSYDGLVVTDYAGTVLNESFVDESAASYDSATGIYTFASSYETKAEGSYIVRLEFELLDNAGNSAQCGYCDAVSENLFPNLKFNQLSPVPDEQGKIQCLISPYKMTSQYTSTRTWQNYAGTSADSSVYAKTVNDFEFVSVQSSTDGINWETIGNARDYTYYKSTLYDDTCKGLLFDCSLTSGSDNYIKTVLKDRYGNEKEYTEKIQNAQLSSITQEPADSGELYWHFNFSESPENYFYVVYKKSDADDSSLKPCAQYPGKASTKITFSDSNYSYFASGELEAGLYNVYVQAVNTKTYVDNDVTLGEANWNSYTEETIYVTEAREAVEIYSITGLKSEPYQIYVSSGSAAALDGSCVPAASQFEINHVSDGVSSGTYTCSVNYNSFEKADDLLYYIELYDSSDGKSYLLPDEDFSLKCNVTYTIKIVAIDSENNARVESEGKEVKITEDNAAPVVKRTTSYYLAPEYYHAVFSVTDDSAINEEIEYWFADKYGYSLEELQKNFTIRKTVLSNANFYYNNDRINLCLYAKIEDAQGNYSLYNYSITSINYTEGQSAAEYNSEDDSVHFETQKNYKNLYNVFSYLENNSWTVTSTSLGGNTTGTVEYSVSLENKNLQTFYRYSCNQYESLSHGLYFDDYIYLCPDYLVNGNSWTGSYHNVINGELGITVFTNRPAFTHVMYCSTNFGNSVKDWETRGMETGIVMSDTTYDYEIPESEIPEGYWYVAITHFADGKYCATTPVQK